MKRVLRRFASWLSREVDDGLPMSPDDRAEREWVPVTDAERSRRRLLRLRLHLLEKRGKGGYR